MSPVNQDAQLNLSRSAMREERIERSPGRTSCEKNIVHKNNVLVLNRKSNFFLLHHGLGTQGRKIIAVESYVQRADRDLSILDSRNDFPQALGNRYAAATDSHQSES